jgi:hypothetical protein
VRNKVDNWHGGWMAHDADGRQVGGSLFGLEESISKLNDKAKENKI